MKRVSLILLLIVLCIVLCSCAINTYNYDHARRYTAGGATVTGRVEKVELNWISGSVYIGTHDGEGVIISETCNRRLDEEDELHWWLDGSTLRVQFAESGVRLSSNMNKSLTVLLPEGMELRVLDVNVVSADVVAEEMIADKIVVNSVSGNVELDAAYVAEVKADTVSGRLTLCFGSLPEEVKANTVSGDVNIIVPADVTVEVDTVSGDVSGSMPMERNGDRYTCGSGRCRIRVNTVSGDVQLDEAK